MHPEHTFYFFFDRPYDPKYVFGPNVVPVVLNPPARHPILFTIWLEWSVRRKLNEINADVFVSFDGLSSFFTKRPVVLIIHDIVFANKPSYLPLINRTYLKMVMPSFIRKAARIVTVSEFVARDVTQKMGIDEHKVSVAHNALPEAFQLQHEEKESPLLHPYFIVPGAILARKNTKHIIQAFEMFLSQNPNFKLVFAGKFMFKPDSATRKLWDRLQKQGALVHVNKPTDTEMVNWVKHARALIYISFFEGFGIPILEGMAAGVPVVTSNTTSMPEVAGDAALLVDPHSPHDIAVAMQKINSESCRQKLIKKGFEQVKKFDWSKSAEQIHQAILEAAGK